MTRIAVIAGGTRPDRPARTAAERLMPAVRAQVFLPCGSQPGEDFGEDFAFTPTEGATCTQRSVFDQVVARGEPLRPLRVRRGGRGPGRRGRRGRRWSGRRGRGRARQHGLPEPRRGVRSTFGPAPVVGGPAPVRSHPLHGRPDEPR